MRSAGQGLAPRRRSAPHQVRSDEYGELLEKLERGDIDPSSARVLLDGLKFQMQCDDKRFAERRRQEITGRDGAPLIPQKRLICLRLLVDGACPDDDWKIERPSLADERPLLGAP